MSSCPAATGLGQNIMGGETRKVEKKENRGSQRASLPHWVFRRWPQQKTPHRTDSASAALIALEKRLRREIGESGVQVRLALYDFAAGSGLEVEAHRKFYPASMIKVLLLLAALEQAEQGRLALEEPYRLRESDKYAGKNPVVGTGILRYAAAGNTYSTGELLYLMIALSDNVATNIIFERIGAAGCAATAKRLGLRESAFTRRFYDLESESSSNRSTAGDLTRMLLALHKREAAGETLTRRAIAMMTATVDKNRIGRHIGSEAIVANKVGTVGSIVGDMALIYFPRRPPLALTIAVEQPPAQGEAARLIGALAGEIVRTLSTYPPV